MATTMNEYNQVQRAFAQQQLGSLGSAAPGAWLNTSGTGSALTFDDYATTTTTGGWNTGWNTGLELQDAKGSESVTADDIRQWKHQVYGNSISTPKKLGSYYRVNEKVDYHQGEVIKDPIDRLRVQVAEWLN